VKFSFEKFEMAGSVEHQERILKVSPSLPSMILVLLIFKWNPGFKFLDLDVENRLPGKSLQKSNPPFISPTHKRTEERAPVWGSEFTSKRRRTTGGDPVETAARLNVKLWLLTDWWWWGFFFSPYKSRGN
jgi:hypothetical protein